MMQARNAVRAVLVSAVLVGLVGTFAAPASVAQFSDAHDGTGQVSAAQYGSGGGGGGGAVTADAGGPYSVDEGNGNSVTLDASGSSTSKGNLNGGQAGYQWTILSGPGSLQQPTNQETVTYTPPNDVNGDTTVTVEVTVTNNKGTTDSDTATITVNDLG